MKKKWQGKSKIFVKWFKQRSKSKEYIYIFPHRYDVLYSLQEKKEKNQSTAISDVLLYNKLLCNYMSKVVVVTGGMGFRVSKCAGFVSSCHQLFNIVIPDNLQCFSQ